MRTVFFALLIVSTAMTAHADKASRENKSGIESYKNGEYDESVQHFTDALVERPESPVLRFNRGTALAAQNNHQEAVNELMTAAKSMETPAASAAAMYNAANSLNAAQKLEDAVALYKQAVKSDQGSEDFRHNLELTMRKMRDKEQQQQQQDQQQQDDKQDQKKENKDNQDQNQKDQNKEDEQEKKDKEDQQEKQNSQTDQQREDRQQEQQEQQSQQQQSDEQPMSPEEAKRLLDALNDEEKKSLSMRYEKMMREMRQGDDW